MSRRIATGTPLSAQEAQRVMATQAEGVGDDYLARLAKYIPAEIIALYVAMVAAAPQSDHHYEVILWVIFGLNAVLVPIYMWIVTSRDPGKKQPLWIQVVLATVAFPVWAFAMGGPFSQLSWYQGWIATILLMFVTVVFGLATPAPGS
jgi:hypothetical protein